MKKVSTIKKTNNAFDFFTKKFVLTISLFLVFILFGCYFFQVQSLINNSYLLSKAEKSIIKIQSQSLSFSQQKIENSSLDKIEQQILALDFVKNDSIKYLPLSNDYLVRAGR